MANSTTVYTIRRIIDNAATGPQTITLTDAEVNAIYRQKEKEFYALDIKHALLEKICDEEEIENWDTWCSELPPSTGKTTEYSNILRRMFKEEGEIDSLAGEVGDWLGGNDWYWEAYWNCIDAGIDEEAEIKAEEGRE